jgi:hypothetical protein
LRRRSILAARLDAIDARPAGVDAQSGANAGPAGADAGPAVMATCSALADVSEATLAESLVVSPAELAHCDAFALDTRLRAAVRAIGCAEPRIGRLLRVIVDQRLYRALGFSSTERYVRERLGISLRKAWALLKIEKTVLRAGAFAEAYDQGRLSWVRALTLVPVVDRHTAGDWIARANAVTVRRLTDEVNWVLDARDVFGPEVPLVPPPMDSVLVSPAVARRAEGIVQISARAAGVRAWPKNGTGPPAAEVVDAEIRFSAPASVVALFRDALDAFTWTGEPRWTAVERLLARVVADWEGEPRHRDPIFARDGWRCAVPACSARRHLHDHHLRFRSHGGGNERANRITVCAAHHLHGIHAGVIRAWGVAPHVVHWQLGVRSGAPPLLSCVGDRVCSEDAT